MTTSPSLLGERLSHMLFHSPLNDFLNELQLYDHLHLKPLLHTSDFSLRLLLSIPLLAHDRDPIFRLATFCLLLEAGCDPDARGADSRCILWELEGLSGELREWIEEEWIKAKSSKDVEGGYSMPKDVELWINDELTEIDKLSTALKKRAEEEKRRELRRLDEELAKLDRDLNPSPAKRAKVEEELGDYEEVVEGRIASPAVISAPPETRKQSPVPSISRQRSPPKAKEELPSKPAEPIASQNSLSRLPPKPRPPPPPPPPATSFTLVPPASTVAPTRDLPSKPPAGQIGFSISRLPPKPSQRSAASPPPLPSPAPESFRPSPSIQPISCSQSAQSPPVDSKPSPSPSLHSATGSVPSTKKSRLPPTLKSRLPPSIPAKADIKPQILDHAVSQIAQPPSYPPPPAPLQRPTPILPAPGPPLVPSPPKSIDRLPPRRPPPPDLFLVRFTKIPSFITHSIFSHYLRNGPRSFDSVTRSDIPYLEQRIQEGKIDVPYLSDINDYPPLPQDVKIWDVEGYKMGSASYLREDREKANKLFNGKKILNCLPGGGIGISKNW